MEHAWDHHGKIVERDVVSWNRSTTISGNPHICKIGIDWSTWSRRCFLPSWLFDGDIIYESDQRVQVSIARVAEVESRFGRADASYIPIQFRSVQNPSWLMLLGVIRYTVYYPIYRGWSWPFWKSLSTSRYTGMTQGLEHCSLLANQMALLCLFDGLTLGIQAPSNGGTSPISTLLMVSNLLYII